MFIITNLQSEVELSMFKKGVELNEHHPEIQQDLKTDL
jgi:hypothetical protein